ncbi:DUF547 domain-containing protein [Sediminibacterium sp.]|uniref:DUF547 domain-containing protein n=1 Tax=Sediminibacterium sp. TaxID=1917865 RepID=UPI0027330F4D|nr:DUF547 domain-containing protein [Sediminibacterium sp.]MDP3394247.1 DUF547 domain-containing protein [Sediminibacterium sp.]MDP3567063.1 DUF547 domain-containing protein [Sediminibacterium sp.]
MFKIYVFLFSMVVFIGVWCYGARPIKKSALVNENAAAMINPMADSMLKISGELLYKVKIKGNTDVVEKALNGITYAQLLKGLSNDAAKKTFWINQYNAWFQILATRFKLSRPAIFTSAKIPIAGKLFSLDDIEHGILRKYRWKWSMGYLPQFMPLKTIKELAVDTIDYRIHFALNCGAKSCPPIAFYRYDKLEQQLDMATVAFVKGESEIDEEKKVITTSKILSWFKGDFGGSNGIRALMTKVFKRDFAGFSIKFNEYNWDADLANFEKE